MTDHQLILGVTTTPAETPGRLADGSQPLWSAATDTFKAVLLEVPDLDAQAALMDGWREVTVHPLRQHAETLMADRLDHLTGRTVRLRGRDRDAQRFDALVGLARYDMLDTGDTFWSQQHGIQTVSAISVGAETVTVDVEGDEPVEALRHHLVGLLDRAEGAAPLTRTAPTRGDYA